MKEVFQRLESGVCDMSTIGQRECPLGFCLALRDVFEHGIVHSSVTEFQRFDPSGSCRRWRRV